MVDEVTWITVASDFVKIAGGALVGGGLAIVTDQRAHVREAAKRKEEFERQRTSALADYERGIVKDISQKFEKYHSLFDEADYSLYIAAFNKAHPNSTIDDNVKSIAEIDEMRLELYERRYELNNIRAELLLIEATEAEEILGRYFNKIFVIFPATTAVKESSLNYVIIEEDRDEMKELRKDFLGCLSSFFKRI